MPIKRGNPRQQGLSRGGLEKSLKIRRSGINDNTAWVTTSEHNPSAAALSLAKLAEFTFNSIAYTVNTLHIIPLKYEGSKCSLTTRKKHLVYHYCILSFLFTRIANIFYICFWLNYIEDFNTLLSLTVLTLLLLCFSLGCSSIFISQETVQLVNCWSQVLGIIAQVKKRQVNMFEDVTLNIKVVGVGGSVLLCSLTLPALPIVYPEIPVSLQYQMKQLLPDLPAVVAQLVCFPLETFFWVVAVLMAGFGACVLIISIDLGNSFGEFAGGCPLNTPVQYEQITRMFAFAKVYNSILDVWYKFVTPPSFFMASGSIVLCLYITFRLTELPIYIYCFYPYLALAVSVVQFGLCYDGLVVINASMEVVSRLQSRSTECFGRMSEQDNAIELRRSKALRPIVVNVGVFTAFDIWVPISLSDEIINQLVFLLAV